MTESAHRGLEASPDVNDHGRRAAPHADDAGRTAARNAGTSAFDHVRQRLDSMVGGFGLDAQRAKVLAVYDAIFRRSLDVPLGTRPTAGSRLTEDDTPVQFATVVGPRPPSLRFVGDAGPFGAEGAVRMRHALAVIEEVAGMLGVRPELDAVRPLLATLAPAADRDLLADPAGAFWIGAAFTQAAPARMRLYVNAHWGNEVSRAFRIDTFAAHFERTHAWEAAREALPRTLSPLGMALTLSPGRKAQGALYFRGFGLRLAEYVTVARAANAEAIAAFGNALLGEEARHPTASAVLSLGFGAGAGLTTELEFCGHCLFGDDGEARRRLLALFATAGVDARPYEILASHVSTGPPEPSRRRMHSFVGVDTKAPEPAFTVYLKPDLALPA